VGRDVAEGPAGTTVRGVVTNSRRLPLACGSPSGSDRCRSRAAVLGSPIPAPAFTVTSPSANGLLTTRADGVCGFSHRAPHSPSSSSSMSVPTTSATVSFGLTL
jgi:hypothetical protein